MAHYVIEVYMRLLRLVCLPILFFSIVSTSSALHGSARWKGVFAYITVYSLGTTFLAACAAAVVFAWIEPKAGEVSVMATQIVEISDPLKHLVPDNIVHMFLSFNVIAIVGLGLALGYATAYIPKEERLLLEGLTRSLFSVFLYLARTLLRALPYGLWAFVLTWYRMWVTHADALFDLGAYVMTVLLANSLQGILILPCVLWLHALSPWKLLKASIPALSVAFLSKSSATTLPITMRVCTERLALPHDYVAMSVPLCTSVNMNGCAAFIYVTVRFVAASHGIHWTWMEQVLWIGLSVLAAFGNAGVPMGCYFMASAFLVMLGVPTGWMDLILPFYLFLDMYETSINVWSDIAVVNMVATRLEVTEDHG